MRVVTPALLKTVSPAAPEHELSGKLSIVKFEPSAPKLLRKYYSTLARLKVNRDFTGQIRVKALVQSWENLDLR